MQNPARRGVCKIKYKNIKSFIEIILNDGYWKDRQIELRGTSVNGNNKQPAPV